MKAQRFKHWLWLGAMFSASLTGVHAGIQLGIVQVAAIGHVFSPPQPFDPPFMKTRVVDYLVDQRQLSHGGAQTPAVGVNFNTNREFVLVLTAPPGKKFWVHVPAGQTVKLAGQMDWQGPDLQANGPSQFGTTTLHFENLEGTAPGNYAQSAALSQGHGFFGFNNLQSLPLTHDIACTAITLTATVPNAGSGPGRLNYTPLADNALVFYYETTLGNDPGAFVSLVSAQQPLLPAPALGNVSARR